MSFNKFAKFKFLIIIFFFFFNNKVVYPEEIEDFYKRDFCVENNPINFINFNVPEEIEIKVNNSKKWAKNLLNLFTEANLNKYKTNNKEWFTFQIDEKYKKKFKSDIKFHFTDPNFKCNSKANVSVKGDLWWHLKWKNGYPFSSMRVDLLNGHLNNTIKFNLLIPESRTSIENKNINLELFVTSLFNSLNLLAPDTYLVKVKVNGHEYQKYLMQEGLGKEFLERRGYIEGPILEGDQTYTAEEFSSGKWRGDLALAKLINPSYSNKSSANREVSFFALSILNNIFINDQQESLDTNQLRCMHDLFTINKEKYFKNKYEIKINQMFEALAVATETTHGMTCDDRKFYFDPVFKILYPIYNDGKSTLNLNDTEISYLIKKKKVSLNSIKGAEDVINLILKIDDNLFFDDLKKRGFELNFSDFKKLKKKVLNNLNSLKNLEQIDNFKPKLNYFSKINSDYFGKELKLIFFDPKNDYLEICDFKLNNCEKINKSNNYLNFYQDLLSQDFKDLKKKNILNKKNNYLFLSNTKNYSSIRDIKDKFNLNYFNKLILKDDFSIEHNDSVKMLINDDEKKINFELLKEDARIIIKGNQVKDWNFFIDGNIFRKNNQNFNFKKTNDMLTGCLSFIDIHLINIKITSNYSLCEDSINFIRVSGDINEMVIKNSLSDALDFDFSKINIKELNIDSANNDCLDLSYGNYVVSKAVISNCGDKAISVGEKSNLTVEYANIQKSKIGIASKDSSVANIAEANIDSEICLASYRKKQEFSGGIIYYNNLNCSTKDFLIQKGSLVKKKNEF